MGDVIYVDFRNKRRVSETWLQMQERLFSQAMKDQDTPTPEEYYGVAPSDSEPQD